jgi:CBS domain containing-hemolysin-like protein
VPVHHGDIDKVAGMVHLRDLVELNKRGQGDLASIVKPVLRVPARTNLMGLLNTMQKRSIHLCLVKDEFNHTLGLVTMEDVLEELVGEIRDEFDAEELNVVTRLRDDCWEANADTLILDFNRQSGWTLEAEKVERIGGLMFNGLGRTPKAGDVLEVGNYRLAATAFEDGKLTRVRLTRLAESGTAEEQGGEQRHAT